MYFISTPLKWKMSSANKEVQINGFGRADHRGLLDSGCSALWVIRQLDPFLTDCDNQGDNNHLTVRKQLPCDDLSLPEWKEPVVAAIIIYLWIRQKKDQAALSGRSR